MSKSANSLADVPDFTDRLGAFDEKLGGVTNRVGELDQTLTNSLQRISSRTTETLEAISDTGDGARKETLARAEHFQSELDEAVNRLEATLKGFRSELERVRV